MLAFFHFAIFPLAVHNKRPGLTISVYLLPQFSSLQCCHLDVVVAVVVAVVVVVVFVVNVVVAVVVVVIVVAVGIVFAIVIVVIVVVVGIVFVVVVVVIVVSVVVISWFRSNVRNHFKTICYVCSIVLEGVRGFPKNYNLTGTLKHVNSFF